MAFWFELSWRRRAAIVLLSLVCSVLLAFAFKPVLHDKAQLLPFTLAVIAASTYGGLTAGLVTTAASFFIADFFFMEPLYESLSVPGDYALLLIFFIFGISLSIVNHALAKANRAVLERSRELARSNAELQRFAYSVAHDLQEPLRAIRSFAELFQERNHAALDQESSRWMDFVLSGADRMKRLIEAILEFSTAGHGTELKQTDADAVVKSALADLRPAIEESRAEVHIEPLPVISADERQLSRVFLNLIGNAIKYGAGNSPLTISVSAEQTPHEWMFSVKDSGSGIDPKYRDRIFETFQRLDRRRIGHGLGLATCKRIVEQHGGRIWVESEPGQGANFRFTLPKR